MFAALVERRSARFRRDCYLSGLVASAVLNSQRHSEDARIWSAFDFVPGAQEEDADRERIKHNLVTLFAMVESSTPEKIADMKRRVLEGIKNDGRDDGEEIWNEVFAEKPKA